MSYEAKCQEDARLMILAELARQVDETLNVLSITRMLDAADMRRPPEWVETQMQMLDTLGAVKVRVVELPGIGKVMTATLTDSGRYHLDRRIRIHGVTPPRDGV